MDTNRRNFLTAIIPLTLGAPLGCFSSDFAKIQNPLPPRPPGAQSPGATKVEEPSNPEIRLGSKDVLKQNQRQIEENVEKIYKLAGDLKDEVEKTDASNTLSLGMIQKAEQIEKLAKQVKNLARGS